MKTFLICFFAILLAVMAVEGSKVQAEARRISQQEQEDTYFEKGRICTMAALEELGQGATGNQVMHRAQEIREGWGW